MENATQAPAVPVIAPQQVVCPFCNGRRGAKRMTGGRLSDWVWESCDSCNGSGYAQVAPECVQGASTIEITYDELYALVSGALSYVAHARRDMRRNGIGSMAVARDVDRIERVATDINSLMRDRKPVAVVS
jgi:hypothetical protein